MHRRTIRAAAVALALSLLAAATTAGAGEAVSAASDAERPFVVKVHADWCHACRALEPTWEALDARVGDGARLVVLDVSDGERLAASRAEAERLGLASFFAEYQSRTGVVAVLRGDDRSTVEVLKAVRDVARYEAAIARARTADPS